jgi:hypothetical protein
MVNTWRTVFVSKEIDSIVLYLISFSNQTDIYNWGSDNVVVSFEQTSIYLFAGCY